MKSARAPLIARPEKRATETSVANIVTMCVGEREEQGAHGRTESLRWTVVVSKEDARRRRSLTDCFQDKYVQTSAYGAFAKFGQGGRAQWGRGAAARRRPGDQGSVAKQNPTYVFQEQHIEMQTRSNRVHRYSYSDETQSLLLPLNVASMVLFVMLP